MFCLHNWNEIKEPGHQYAHKRVCKKCGKKEKEVWIDDWSLGNVPMWKPDY
jgi:hypothetical protein